MSLLGDLIGKAFGDRPQTTAAVSSGIALRPELVRWLDAAYGEDGEVAENQALQDLRAMGEAGAEAIRSAHGQVAHVDPDLGWALVRCAAQVRSTAMTAFLVDVLSSPVGTERSPNVDQRSSVGEEIAQRFQAIRGLRDLAADGDDRARRGLSEALSHPLFAVRAAGYQELRDHFGQDESWRRYIQEEDRAALDGLRRVDIADVGAVGPVDLQDLPHPDDVRPRSSRDKAPYIQGRHHG